MTNQEAIEDIRDNIKPIVGGKSLDMAIEALEERKTGRWIIGEDTGAKMYECSECKCRMIASWYDKAVGTKGFNYCPYCGAKMEVEHEHIHD